MKRSRKFILVALVAACMLMLLTVMSGCRPSDALKEIIYDQSSDIVDYDNELKFYISNDQAELENENIPSTETNRTEEETDEKQNIVVYSSEPNSPDFTAKQSLWSMDPDFEGIEASVKVNFYESDDPNVSKQHIKTDHPIEDSDDSDDAVDYVEDGTELDDDKAGTAESPTSSNVDGSDSSAGGNGGSKDPNATTAEGETNDPRGNVDEDLTGDYADIPKHDSVAAYGDVAVLVQIIGGNGALAAADKTLLSGDFKSKVFTKASIKTGWSDDGTDKDYTSDKGTHIDTDAIIKSGAEALLVPSGSYLTSKQKKALNKGGVEVDQVYAMTNSKYIKKNADTIGEMLSESKDIQYSDPEGRASEYKEFFNTTIDEACKAANGGDKKLAGGDTIYERKNTTKYTSASSYKYTLLIDDYDTSAEYTKSYGSWTPKSNGAALSTVGYSTTPVSFYLQAGGLVNTAAAKGGKTAGQVIDWQFNSNMAAFNKGKWTFSTGGAVDKSRNISVNASGGWTMSFFTATSGSGNSSDTGGEIASGAPTNNFGTSSFPKVIAATQQIQTKLIENSTNSSGIYHPYSSISTSLGNCCGVYSGGSGTFMSAIGADGATQVFSKGLTEDDVLVNPHGLFSSWTESGSPESFLEAAWACEEISGKEYPGGWKQRVKDFYEQFYDGYTPDMDTIEKGAEK